MLLRTRVIVIVIAVFFLLAGVLVIAGIKREELAAKGHAAATVVTQRTVWQMIIENLSTEMEQGVGRFQLNRDLAQALRSEDRSQLAQIMRPLLAGLSAERVEIVARDGTLLYNSGGEPFWSATLDAARADNVVSERQTIRGMELDASRKFVAMVAVPLLAPVAQMPQPQAMPDETTEAGDQPAPPPIPAAIPVGTGAVEVVGVLTLTAPIDSALAEFRKSTSAEALLVNRRGRLIQGTLPDLWDALGGESFFTRREEIVTIEHKGQSLAVTTVPLAGSGNEVRAYFIIAKDVTASFREQRKVSIISATLVVAVLGIVMAGLFRYLSKAFGPLEEAITVLNALSRGDTTVMIETPRRNDEIGRIAHTVDVFRRHMSQIERMKRSREKQRRRQERFIRKEMNKLADTLDEDARGALIEDLETIETEAAKSAADGNKDELGVMALAFQHMADRVRDQHTRLGELVEELRDALKTKTAFVALQQELDIAREIQMSMLPQEFPPRDDVEVHGCMTPAKEVGGDFYDFFMIDENRVGVVVADVSGKGVPAAFFMAMSRTLLKATALFGEPPGVVMEKLNDLLAENNSKNLFVTVFYGILDLRYGRFDYCNGGHPPPMLMRADGSVIPMELTDGMALAIMDGMDYEEKSIEMAKGDAIFFYTDGVTEAFDPEDNEFSEARIKEILENRWIDIPTGEISDLMTEEVRKFAREAPQSDDITCVCLRFTGEPVAESEMV